jgi:hypothetical protein
MDSKPWYMNLPFLRVVFLTASIIYCVAPPVIYCYFNHPSIFFQTELFKLLLLTLSISVLIFAVNYFMIFMIYLMAIKKTDAGDIKLYESTAQTLLLLYTIVMFANLVNYVFSGSIFSISTSLRILYGIKLVFIIGGIISVIDSKRSS